MTAPTTGGDTRATGADASAPGASPPRPPRMEQSPVPDLPVVDETDAENASTQYSHYRSGLSRFRTGLSEHRTDLSEFRTDLSEHRTHLSDERTEMSMRRTGMSIHRTRMSADRTLMSELRTALSLIGFGFTIYQAFHKFYEAGLIHRTHAPRNFGLALILLGIALLVGGVVRQVKFGHELRAMRALMAKEGLIHAETSYPISLTLMVSVGLIAVGIAAVIGILVDPAS